VLAHRAGELARHARQFFEASRETLFQDSGEYLQEEARLLPTRIEVAYFLGDVDRLRDDVERLQARVQRLIQTLDNTP
jgi:ubiquinone biosynthesis protein UbiJ